MPLDCGEGEFWGGLGCQWNLLSLDPYQCFLPHGPFYLALVFVLEMPQKLMPESFLNLAHTSLVLTLLLCISSKCFQIFKNISSKIFSLLCKIPTLTFASFSETEIFLWNLRTLLSHLLCYILKTAVSSSALHLFICVRTCILSLFLRPVPPNVPIFPTASSCFRLPFLNLSFSPCLQTCLSLFYLNVFFFFLTVLLPKIFNPSPSPHCPTS